MSPESKQTTSGIYQWTVGFTVAGEQDELEPDFQLKFGPSAWYANEKDKAWKRTVSASAADYSCLFLTRRENEGGSSIGGNTAGGARWPVDRRFQTSGRNCAADQGKQLNRSAWPQPYCRGWTALHQLPFDVAVLTHPGSNHHGPQPSLGWLRGGG